MSLLSKRLPKKCSKKILNAKFSENFLNWFKLIIFYPIVIASTVCISLPELESDI